MGRRSAVCLDQTERIRQFLGQDQARGSLIEMETQVVIGASLGYVSQDTLGRVTTVSGEVSRLLHGLMQSIQPQESH